jgi:hypothetical protein
VKFNDLYCSSNVFRAIKSRRIRWAGIVACLGRRVLYRLLDLNLEGTTPPRKTRHRWEDNIKMDLQEVEWVRRLD